MLEGIVCVPMKLPSDHYRTCCQASHHQPLVQDTKRCFFHVVSGALQVAINWAMCKGCIPIPGVKTMAMAEDNLGAVGWRLFKGEEADLDAAAARVSRRMIQNIFQTA
jgi:diketogulonate reductase-like aldo/keto reductase